MLIILGGGGGGCGCLLLLFAVVLLIGAAILDGIVYIYTHYTVLVVASGLALLVLFFYGCYRDSKKN